MKRFIVLLLGLSLCLTGCAATQVGASASVDASSPAMETATPSPAPVADANFRNATWGMTAEEVKASEEKAPVGETDGFILYSGTPIGGIEASCGYAFYDNELHSGSYIFTNTHSNDTLYIDDFKKISDLVTEKYGQPVREDVIWLNDLFKDDRSQWGLAISSGQLIYQSDWNLEGGTMIRLTLKGDNYKINFILSYLSPDYESLKKTDTTGL